MAQIDEPMDVDVSIADDLEPLEESSSSSSSSLPPPATVATATVDLISLPVPATTVKNEEPKAFVDETEKVMEEGNLTNVAPVSINARYENHGGTFTTGVNIFSPVERLKVEERAKRFGITTEETKNILQNEGDLYESMGLTEDVAKNIRLNVLHMRGTEEMSTKDVFKYFEDYAPASIEWINDVSCNVVWLDTTTAARALLGLSKRIVGLTNKENKLDETSKKEGTNFVDEGNQISTESCIAEDTTKDTTVIKSEDRETENTVNIADIECPLPPAFWRKGVDYPKSKGIFLRFATRSDKKQPNAEKISEYYKKYGNPNFGGIKGILTQSRKRLYRQTKQGKRRKGDLDAPIEEDFLEEEDENLVGEETGKKQKKNPWGALSRNWGVNDSVEEDFLEKPLIRNREFAGSGGSIKERLGMRVRPEEHESRRLPLSRSNREDEEGEVKDSDSESSSNSEGEWCRRSKVPRMRMHADDEEEKIIKKRIKHRLNSINIQKNTDLRSRLGNRTQPPVYRDSIQVVVTNTEMANVKSRNSEEEEEDTDEEKMEPNEEEEGEIIDSSTEGKKSDEEESNDDDVEDEEEEEEEEDDSDGSSDLSAKEVQGPKGSVVKVVQHKPRLASTVWARINHNASDKSNADTTREKRHETKDLRETLKSGMDLRARLDSKNNTRNRSLLRIEVRNDMYNKKKHSDDSE